MRRPSSNATFTSDVLRKPVQITADPRVYKGSVFANRRLAHDRVKQVELKEKKYRVGVIREQLNTILPRVPVPRKSNPPSSLLPALSSKTRFTSTYLPEISSRNGSALCVSIDKTRGSKSFAAAKFMPVPSTKPGNTSMVSNHTFNIKNRFQEQPNNSPKTLVSSQSKLLSTLNKLQHLIFMEKLRFEDIVNTGSNHKLQLLHRLQGQCIQLWTVEFKRMIFDQQFEDLVKELANSAIEMATINLEAENTINSMRKTAEATEHELRAVARKQNIESAEWKRKMDEKDNELETWKQQEADAREAQLLAQATYEEITRRTLNNLQIMERNSKRSIGLDTRDIVATKEKLVILYGPIKEIIAKKE
ncbi:Protein CBG25298 [Caenorhabditis briggsae]|uniref:Protein CBG25298 n=1 Tax=Caenorhabditis briggsae TaxID=6238 RepID=B6IIG8_CAEBR|nr:Protein CBG25298 [Caenorhabditis briggsae]CAR99698.1 Protein CBG25298 [Caenorhabditis briggsae]